MATHDTINPATGEVIKTYTLHTDEEAAEIVGAAHAAFDHWKRVDVAERADVVRRIGEVLEENVEELSTLMTTEMGKTRRQAKQEIRSCVAICSHTADTVADELADEEREYGRGRAVVTHQPVGVILGIQPWNFPVYQALRYSVAQLAAGNTVLLKHANNVWGTALELERLYREAGVPADAFRVLLTSDEQTSALIGHDAVRGVTLTGSTRAGSAVAAIAGEHLKKTVMELGSNDAYLVLSDADVDLAVKTCVMGRLYNNGETCVAAKRFIVTDAVFDDFAAGIAEAFRGQSMGDPMERETDLGPIAREDLRDNLHRQVAESVAAGATAVVGGVVPDGPGSSTPRRSSRT